VRAIRAGLISSRELVEHAFRRIRKHNPKVNAFITPGEEQAVQQARSAAEDLGQRKRLGRLARLADPDQGHLSHRRNANHLADRTDRSQGGSPRHRALPVPPRGIARGSDHR
jgi:hypothetical protein